MDDSPPPPTSPPAPSASARPVVRVLTLSLLAAMVYGAWAWLANRSHGPDAAARGGLTQALSSAVATALIGTVIEALLSALPPSRARPWIAAAAAGTATAALHVGLHLSAGTPEVARTVLPSVGMGYVFAALYALRVDSWRRV